MGPSPSSLSLVLQIKNGFDNSFGAAAKLFSAGSRIQTRDSKFESVCLRRSDIRRPGWGPVSRRAKFGHDNADRSIGLSG